MENNRQEDLDMLYVVKSIKRGTVNIFKSIGWLIDYTLNKFLPIMGFILAFTCVGLGIYFARKPYYASQLTISHIRFENDYCREMISNLDSYINASTNNTDLASTLSISVQDAGLIKNISYASLNENIAKRFADSVSVLIPFKVEVEVYDNSVLDTLQKGILNYLESNAYATKIKEIDMQALKKTEQKVINEIIEIDSLKQIVNQSIIPRSTGNGIILGEPIDPLSVYRRAMEVHDKLLYVNKQQELNNSFNLVLGFSKNSRPSSSGILLYLIISIVVGYLVGLIWLLRRETRNKA